MKRDFFIRNWHLLLINFVTICLFVNFYGHFGNIMVDSFREMYIPLQMLKGEVLYKNIFCIYAPLGYMINAVLLKLFGAKLCVLYFAGLAASLGIFSLTFNILKKFLPKIYSLVVVLFIISASFLSPNVFNFVLPYSYGLLYGTLFALLCIYFCINKKIPLAYAFYALAVCTKYEFIFLLPALIWYSKKDILKGILITIIIPILVLLPLFLQGVTFDNLSTIFAIIVKMSSTKTLYWFYSISGLIFNVELIRIYGINFLKIFLPLLFVFYFRSWFLVCALFIFFYFFLSPAMLIFAFPLILILFAKEFHNLSRLKKFVIVASLLISLKLFFALTLMSYGVYFLPFALISLFILVPKRYKKSLIIIFAICTLVFGIKNSVSLIKKNVKIKTDVGTVYAEPEYGKPIKELIEYFSNKNKKILVIPECLAFNVLSSNSTDNKFYSLIPLYIETFGEENIIKRLELYPPDYIVISNYDTSDYYYSYFGQDYAQSVFEYIIQNYKHTKLIGDKFSLNIYERKKY